MMRKRTVGVVAVAVLAASVGVLTVATAATPARLRSATPADGASLTTAPDQVSLRFSSRLDPGQVHVAVVDAAQHPVARGAPTVAGDTVVQPVVTGPAGSYLVGYHVVFGNGKEVTGFVRFSVRSPADPPETAAPSSDPVPPSVLALPGADGAGADGAGVDGGGTGHDHTRLDRATLAVVGVDAAAFGVGLVLILRRRRRRG